eukprot:COSAG01_NODE_6856_length_3468_cov_1.978629_3_plen_74_part_00
MVWLMASVPAAQHVGKSKPIDRRWLCGSWRGAWYQRVTTCLVRVAGMLGAEPAEPWRVSCRSDVDFSWPVHCS